MFILTRGVQSSIFGLGEVGDSKKINILTCVVRKKISERNKKNITPLQVKWSVPQQRDLVKLQGDFHFSFGTSTKRSEQPQGDFFARIALQCEPWTVGCRTCSNCLVTVELDVQQVVQCFCLDAAFVTGLYQFHL